MTVKKIRFPLILCFLLGMAGLCREGSAGDYFDREGQESGSVLLDTIDRDYPPDTSGTVNDPRILEPLRRHESSTELMDKINRYYPPDTGGTHWDPRIPFSTDGNESAVELMDIINEHYPVFGPGSR